MSIQRGDHTKTNPQSDREQISALLAQYNRAIDSGDIEGFVATFHPDGIFDGVHGRFEGEAALRRFITMYWTDSDFKRLWGAQHWISNIDISVSGSSATSYCYGTVVSAGESGNLIMGTWHYQDSLSKTNGSWKFSKRYVRPFKPSLDVS